MCGCLRYDIDRGRRITVDEIWFRGIRAFSSAELLKAIQIQPARFLRKSTYSISKTRLRCGIPAGPISGCGLFECDCGSAG